MMLHIRMNRSFALVLAVFGLAAVMMLGNMTPLSAKDPILTKRTVELFLASYPDVKTITERHAQQKGAQLAGATDHLAAVIQAASDDAIVGEVDGAVQAHGFTGASQWVSIATSVVRAYAHLSLGKKVTKANRKLDKAIAKIEKNGFFSKKQKAKLIKALREGAGELLEEPPEENIATVEPMKGEIDAVIMQ